MGPLKDFEGGPMSTLRRPTMKRSIHCSVALAIAVSMASAVSLAQSTGEGIYKAHCQSCHGAVGMADTGPGRVTRTRPITDPEVRGRSAQQMFDDTKNGKDKMRAFKDKLTDQQIHDSVTYFRTFLK
jgi:mono/diheme cytochrome c family protein